VPLPSSRIIEGVRIRKTLDYIHNSWIDLTRTLRDLPMAVQDLKVPHDPDKPWPLYISPLEDQRAIKALLNKSFQKKSY
jgi:hypothetical protein